MFATLLSALGSASLALGGNFNDDGFEDVAIGAPLAVVTGLGGANDGAVYVLPGANSIVTGEFFDFDHELTLTGGMFDLEQDATPSDSAHFGQALAIGDFDGDGIDDLAIGAPGATVSGLAGAGAVVIVYSANPGLQPSVFDVFTQNSPGMKDKVDTWKIKPHVVSLTESFGKSLVSGDFDGDGFADLAIGVNEKVGSKADAGGVQVLYGGPNGLTADRDQLWTQNSPGVNGAAETGDEFGSVLAAADFDQDGKDDLVIATPLEAIGTNAIGVVQILHGGKHGLTSTGDQLLKPQNLSNFNITHSQFGAALATGDMNGDGFPDLAVSNPLEVNTVESVIPLHGSVWIYRGGAGGLDAANPVQFTQSGLGIPEDVDNDFGRALALGDFDVDGFADLVIGEPGQISSGTVHGGGVWVVRGSETLDGLDRKFWSQDSAGIMGVAGAGDRFGGALAVADVNGDGSPDLLIGAPDDVNDSDGVGCVNCLFSGTGGLVSTLNAFLAPDTFAAPPGFLPPAVFGFAIAR